MSLTLEESTGSALRSFNIELSKAFGQIDHCLEQLNEQQVWWRPRDEMNSIGNILLHLAGNIRQWVISGLEGVPDRRNRPQEFAERGPIPLDKLLEQLRQTVLEAQAVITELTAERLGYQYQIQGFDVSGWDVVIHIATHFRGHVQEIICLTRQILGDDYRFAFVPATPEQGAVL